MTDSILRKIEKLTTQNFIHAFQTIQLTKHQIHILQTHLAASEQKITMRHLSQALGYKKWNSANLHYGKLARIFCNFFHIKPSTKLSILVTFHKDKNYEWTLQLRPSVIEALQSLEIINKNYIYPEEIKEQPNIAEGSILKIQVNAYERNPIARNICIAHYGCKCIVCGLSFEKIYGKAAKGLIHIHHLKPLSEIREKYIFNPVQDLRPVCANCHAVIHKKLLLIE